MELTLLLSRDPAITDKLVLIRAAYYDVYNKIVMSWRRHYTNGVQVFQHEFVYSCTRLAVLDSTALAVMLEQNETVTVVGRGLAVSRLDVTSFRLAKPASMSLPYDYDVQHMPTPMLEELPVVVDDTNEKEETKYNYNTNNDWRARLLNAVNAAWPNGDYEKIAKELVLGFVSRNESAIPTKIIIKIRRMIHGWHWATRRPSEFKRQLTSYITGKWA